MVPDEAKGTMAQATFRGQLRVRLIWHTTLNATMITICKCGEGGRPTRQRQGWPAEEEPREGRGGMRRGREGWGREGRRGERRRGRRRARGGEGEEGASGADEIEDHGASEKMKALANTKLVRVAGKGMTAQPAACTNIKNY